MQEIFIKLAMLLSLFIVVCGMFKLTSSETPKGRLIGKILIGVGFILEAAIYIANYIMYLKL